MKQRDEKKMMKTPLSDAKRLQELRLQFPHALLSFCLMFVSLYDLMGRNCDLLPQSKKVVGSILRPGPCSVEFESSSSVCLGSSTFLLQSRNACEVSWKLRGTTLL